MPLRVVELVVSFLLQLGLEGVELRHARAKLVLLQAQFLDLERILPAQHVQVQLALHLHLEAVDRVLALRERLLEVLVARAQVEREEDAADRRVLVLEREVAVARGVDPVARDLPLDPHARELRVVREEIPPDGQRQLRDTVDAFGHARVTSCSPH